MIGRLYHYSQEPFALDRARVYQPQGDPFQMKPHGLWLSVESDDEDSFGWRDWCVREGFGLSRLAHRAELSLRPDVNVLHLESSSALVSFTRRYQRTIDGFSCFQPMDWVAVAHDYQGLVIAPYDWSLRLDLHWYYAWDCASACIWDCSTLTVG